MSFFHPPAPPHFFFLFTTTTITAILLFPVLREKGEAGPFCTWLTWQGGHVDKQIGVRARGQGGAAAPQNLGNSDFLGSKRKFGQSQVLKTFLCFFFIIILKRWICSILIWKKSWSSRNNPVTFSRHWLPRHVMSFWLLGKGITCWFTYLQFFIVEHCTALH